MTLPTWAELKARVIAELDLAEEDFIDSNELLLYANDAINNAESIILSLSEDYFLAKPVRITLVSGTSNYTLPSDIYGQKIRLLMYDNGTRWYQIKKVKDLVRIADFIPTDNYQYVLTNDPTTGNELCLYPTPAENGQFVTLWYLRNARTIVNDTDTIDLPEAYDYVTQYIKDCVMNKERLQPDAPPSAKLLRAEELLKSSLHQRSVDEPITSTDDFIDYTMGY